MSMPLRKSSKCTMMLVLPSHKRLYYSPDSISESVYLHRPEVYHLTPQLLTFTFYTSKYICHIIYACVYQYASLESSGLF